MVAQLNSRDLYSKKQKLLHKADNYIGRKVWYAIICYILCTNNIAKNTKNVKFDFYRFKVYPFYFANNQS